MKLDKDERSIEMAFRKFSTIQVDTEKIVREVNMKNNFDFVKPTPRKKVGLVVAATVALMVLMAGTLYAVGLGVFDRFLSQHVDVPFVEVVNPVEEYLIADGFRVDIIAAGKFDNQGIVYLSVQDISGQNRLTENAMITHFWPLSGMSEIIYFDAEASIAHFELSVNALWEVDLAGDEILEYIDVGRVSIMFDWFSWFSEVLDVELSGLQGAEVMPVPEVAMIDRVGEAHYQMLMPAMAGAFPELPYSNGHQWISGMAVVDGYLHVQLGERIHRGAVDIISGRMGRPMLINPAGETSEAEFCIDTRVGELPDWVAAAVYLFTDENLQPIEAVYASYTFREAVFRVNIDELDAYTLVLEGSYTPESVSFDMGLHIYADDDSQIRMLSDVGLFGDVNVGSIIISPRGVRLTGHVEGHDGMAAAGDDAGQFRLISEVMEVALETDAGIVLMGLPLSSNRVVLTDAVMPINTIFRAETPVDVTAVTAVIIDGMRLPLR